MTGLELHEASTRLALPTGSGELEHDLLGECRQRVAIGRLAADQLILRPGVVSDRQDDHQHTQQGEQRAAPARRHEGAGEHRFGRPLSVHGSHESGRPRHRRAGHIVSTHPVCKARPTDYTVSVCSAAQQPSEIVPQLRGAPSAHALESERNGHTVALSPLPAAPLRRGEGAGPRGTALRDAVASGREGQAYLFSGPRGTGKTTSARILAKVLNCERPVDGEPCCECPSCLAVESGTSYDVHELDAASNNGVDAIRELIERASLGTPGRHKVYILDEVHMLSRAAEAALLKTLEEPPPHVVFVLATTDPQKVSDTIRSRTQHLRFHLLPADTLAEHVRWIAADAGLDLDDARHRRRPRPGRRIGPRHAVGARADRHRRATTARRCRSTSSSTP